MATKLTLDTSLMDKNMQKLMIKVLPSSIIKGLGKAGLQLINDSVMQEPTVPLKEGTLRGSSSMFVQNELVYKADPKAKSNPCTSHNETIKQNTFQALVGFNTVYAARLHEHPEFKFTEAGSGAKFLESKMTSRKDVYMDIVANTIKESL